MCSISQQTVALFGGESSFSALPQEDAALIAGIVQQRLLLSLCMTEPPTEEPDYSLWMQLLSVAIVTFDSINSDTGIKSESMRNYSYTMRDTEPTWEDLKTRCGDLLGHFSKCTGGIQMQADFTSVIYGNDFRSLRHGCI